MSLIKFLKENEKSARKIFGKRELDIILKQLNGFDLTQSEKNRLSRDIRQKFKFIGTCARFKDYFDLKKNKINKEIIKESVEVLINDKAAKDFDEILLTGSFADKSFTKRSDIDLCVVFKKQISLKEATLFRKRMLGKLNSKVDLQVFNVLPEKIKKSIMNNNKVLFKQKDFKNVIFKLK